MWNDTLVLRGQRIEDWLDSYQHGRLAVSRQLMPGLMHCITGTVRWTAANLSEPRL